MGVSSVAGSTNTGRSKHDSKLGQDQIGTAIVQMIRQQVVGALDSFLSNRQNNFSEMVNCSSLDKRTRHQLDFLNRWRAWQTLSVPFVMRDGSTIRTLCRKHLAENLCVFLTLKLRRRFPTISYMQRLLGIEHLMERQNGPFEQQLMRW
ncbi:MULTISPECIES: hypothetical protein [Caballeronia]|uniref:hypothetical protein n=1 Tax=Caballeronia TaxID=1827195 RepID=UPI00025BAD5E|nr:MULTISPECIES: hypothetical protein [Caballeronia]EKS70377.1 hypothetical protein BURK_019935 [Burkholderia sp. SJ98]MCE4546348.1 hypothetical protein [Caballeronia sp. PC1]MCE4573177.1 hypothetical protein [Caballeronia sp. CLC5]